MFSIGKIWNTPRKINMEPENTPLEEENHLPNYHFQFLCESSGVYFISSSAKIHPKVTKLLNAHTRLSQRHLEASDDRSQHLKKGGDIWEPNSVLYNMGSLTPRRRTCKSGASGADLCTKRAAAFSGLTFNLFFGKKFRAKREVNERNIYSHPLIGCFPQNS